MTTSAKKINIPFGKFISQQQLVDNFLEYLSVQDFDYFKTMYPVDGFFSGGSLTDDGADRLKVGTPLKATDGLGHLLSLDPSEAAVQFENTIATPYYVGLRFNYVPSGIEVNPKTGKFDYSKNEERVGELASPDAVVDNGATITFTVDSVTEASVDNTGRKVLCYLKTAVGEADAFYEGTVFYSGGVNKVTTTHLLGQTAGGVSVTASDYQVLLIGPTVKKNTDLSTIPSVAFVGTVTGAGAGNTPTTFDTTTQTPLFTPGSMFPVNDEVKAFITGGGLISWDLTSEDLTLGADVEIKLPHRGFNYTISAQTVSSLADGEVVYFDADGTGGVKALVKVAINSMPNVVTNFPLVMRVGNNIYFKGGLELKGDASTSTQGRINDITQDLLTYLGADDESDSDPNYTSERFTTQGSSLTTALSDHDLEFSKEPLYGYASTPTADAILNINSNRVVLGDGSIKETPSISGVSNLFVASTINFQTGATTGGTIQTLGGAFALPSSSIGLFRRMVMSYDSVGNLLDTAFSAEVASEGSLPDPTALFTSLGQTLHVLYIDLEATGANAFKTAGSGSAVIENGKIHRLSPESGSIPSGIDPFVAFDSILIDDVTGNVVSDDVNGVIVTAG